MVDKLPHLSDEYHYAIASVSVRATQMDHHVEKVVDLCLRSHPKTAAFLLKSLGTDRVVNLMESLLLDAFPEEEEQIANLMAQIREVRSERNEVIHWTWGFFDVDGKRPLVQLRPHRKSGVKYKDAEDIQRVANDAYVATHALLEWQSLLGHRLREASRGNP